MRQFHVSSLVAVALVTTVFGAVHGQEKKEGANQVYPLAVFPFTERSSDVRELGGQVSDLLFANLVTDPTLFLVEREEIKKILDEQELNLSGLVNPDQATKVGQLTGAKILVTGAVLQVQDNLFIVAKVVGTETSRVLGASAKGKPSDELDELVKRLAADVAKTIHARAGELVAKPTTREDRLAALKKAIGNKKRPSVYIDIPERHVGQATIDPAAETELALFCTELGFKVIDPDEGEKSDADVLIVGEGFSEFATRHGNLVSVKSRLEVKGIERATGRVLAIDRETTVAVDLTEQIAGKSALQDAAARIGQRLLPKVVGPEEIANKKDKNRKKPGKENKKQKEASEKE